MESCHINWKADAKICEFYDDWRIGGIGSSTANFQACSIRRKNTELTAGVKMGAGGFQSGEQIEENKKKNMNELC